MIAMNANAARNCQNQFLPKILNYFACEREKLVVNSNSIHPLTCLHSSPVGQN